MKNRRLVGKCICSYLNKFAMDSSRPVEYDEEYNKFSIALTESQKVEINFCFVCGGKEIRPLKEKNDDECLCNSVFEWAKVASYPVKYNVKFEEYYLVGDNKSLTIIYFCPICRGQMPRSKRGDFFTIPSEEEMNEITANLIGAKEIGDYLRILGTPDEEFGTVIGDEVLSTIYCQKNIQRTLVFKSVGETLDLSIQEDKNGKITYFFAGKPKEADR
ncbi:MAG: DUF6980 family protein [Pyrinomonadaceae bacterium]